MSVCNCDCTGRVFVLLLALATLSLPQAPVGLTLDEALAITVGRSSRSEIIAGNLEVAERKYFAERVSFYVPSISLNGNLPAYRVDESFRFFGGAAQKQLVKTTDLDFTGNIKLDQNLITGGRLTVAGNLYNRSAEYPLSSNPGIRLDQTTREGNFDFEYVQPLLQPSQEVNDLRNSRDDLELARLSRLEETTVLKKEVIEAFFGVLQTAVKLEMAHDKLKSAGLNAGIDSAKLRDGVIGEDAWLESASARLDAELETFDVTNQHQERNRELAILLDRDANETLDPETPDPGQHLDERQKNRYVTGWEECSDVLKAYYEYRKEERAAGFAASSHGLNADLSARYSLGRGTVETDGFPDDDIETNGWEVSLNFTYPIWDGGASGAAVQAARLAEEQKRIEYERAKRSARAEIVNLINRLDVGYRKLQVLQQQIDITSHKLDIARARFEDGQISEVEFLTSKIDHLEARDKYLEELKNYLLDRATLEGKYSS